MAGLNLALGRFSVAKMAISWNNWFETRPYQCSVSEVHCINWKGVFQGVTLTLALSHDGRGDFRALICSTNL